MDRLRILALEPYYGGSHRAVLDGLVAHVDAEWVLFTLPARKWKWRMRGASMTFAERMRDLADGQRFDLVLASTFLNLAEWRGLVTTEIAAVPAIAYFHENQLVYPSRHTAEWDFQFPLTNITTALSAERCLFNTEWNRAQFLAEIPAFLAGFPDYRPHGVPEAISVKSAVLPPPFDTSAFDCVAPTRGKRCRIVWPHRWEHDKDPRTFFDAVCSLAEEGLDFEVAVAGRAFADVPPSIAQAEDVLGGRVVHLGEPKSREEYARLLASSDVAVSTAVNEFFGIAMIEAAYAGCYPLVPDRLAYPEIYPLDMRYSTREELTARLRSFISAPPAPNAARGLAERFTFNALAGKYAAEFAATARTRSRSQT